MQVSVHDCMRVCTYVCVCVCICVMVGNCVTVVPVQWCVDADPHGGNADCPVCTFPWYFAVCSMWSPCADRDGMLPHCPSHFHGWILSSQSSKLHISCKKKKKKFRLMTMHHRSKFGSKRFSNAGNNIWTNIHFGHMNRMTDKQTEGRNRQSDSTPKGDMINTQLHK